jgi:predicted RND superfamily exporter protein
VSDARAPKVQTPDPNAGFPSAPPCPDAGATGQPGPVCRTCVPWLIRHRRPVLIAAALVTLVSGFFAAKLYTHLRSELEELLPNSAPSVVALHTVRNKLHTVTHLSVVLEGTDGDALDRFADDLAAKLKALPPGLIESVEYRTDAQEAFVRKFGGFYLSTEDLDTIQKRLDARIAWEKKKANPLNHLLDDEEDIGPPPSIDFSDIEAHYSGLTGARAQFRKGYFQTPDGKLLVLLVRPPEYSTGLESNKRLRDAVKHAVEELHPERYDPTLHVGYDGEVETLVEEQSALVSDLVSSTAVVLVLVFAVLWIYFRRWTAILAILGVLAVGCSLTFGLAYLLIGYLNANTAFLGSIVVGNGINVSIILVARFLEERRRGVPLERAIQTAWSGTLAATFVAAFGAGLAYLSLAVTSFRGFSQFGVIGGMGMALCWCTAYLLAPPLLATLDRRSKRGIRPERRSLVGTVVGHVSVRHGRAVRIGSLALLLLSIAGVFTYRGSIIEYDLDKLRAAKSAESGAQHWGRKVDKVFNAYLTPTVIRAETPAELDKVVAELNREREALGKDDPLREVRTIETAIPPHQEEKVARLKKLHDTLTESRLAQLDPEARKKALDFRPPANPRPVTLQDLPEALRLPLVEKDGTAGRIALVFPKKVGFITPQESKEMATLIRGAIAKSGARAQAVGQNLLFLDIADAIVRDGPLATLLAISAVVVLVALALRKIRPTVEVLGSLFLGVAWLIGAAAWGRVRLNFLNFVVLPITFGIGVDYAVNIVQRWRIEGPGSLERVLRETGGAVALCSLTTIIGYGSLLVADNRALRNFGLLASLGEFACITAALVALPAWLLRPKAHRPEGGGP